MPMTQVDIRNHYESLWKSVDEKANDQTNLRYSNPIEDQVVAPIYKQLVADLRISVDGGKILDVGCGAGRWVRHFLEWFTPAQITGIDATQSSADLNQHWNSTDSNCKLEFRPANITDPNLDLGQTFDLINVGNVLFHIPEADLFNQALKNLARHLAPGGNIITTEYMPRTTMRTEWMLVRSRYDFEAAAQAVGLRIVDVRAFGFFINDPMGLDGPDNGTRWHFNQVRSGIDQLLAAYPEGSDRKFIQDLFTEIERSTLAFCTERVPHVDLPSQKLVALTHLDQ